MTYHEISICADCFSTDLRSHMHPANPCPSCGGKVLDRFSAQVTHVRDFLGFKTGRCRINLNSLRIVDKNRQDDKAMSLALKGAKATTNP